MLLPLLAKVLLLLLLLLTCRCGWCGPAAAGRACGGTSCCPESMRCQVSARLCSKLCLSSLPGAHSAPCTPLLIAVPPASGSSFCLQWLLCG